MDSYSDTLDYLYGLRNRGSKFGIDRMRLLVEALDHPQKKFPVIHIAGTNGKGSVAAMLESIYRENGYKTGLFSSPHLVHLGERIQVNREILSEEAIIRYTAELRQLAVGSGPENPYGSPTFFEYITAMAFIHFPEASVEIALVETGLGGRLDATNVVDPELSIITTISPDHTEILGDTLAEIAVEKAGIIHSGKPVLIGKLPPEAEAAVVAVAEERGSKLYSLAERFPDGAVLPETNLVGDFQRWNAALAIYATEILAHQFPVRSTETLLQIDWPGRWQTLRLSGRSVILDASHNPEGIHMLDRNLRTLRKEQRRRPIIVAGTLGEAKARSLMQVVETHACELHLVEPKQERATSFRILQDFLQQPAVPTTLEAIFPSPGTCTLGQPGDTIVLTGSIYLVGEALEQIQGSDSVKGSRLNDKVGGDTDWI